MLLTVRKSAASKRRPSSTLGTSCSSPRADSNDRAWHTVIVVERTSSSNEHTFLVDASWGVDLYGADAGGVGRRKFVHDTSSGRWWDIHPIYGTKAHENAIGPYDGHPIHGMFRAKHKK
jgi:hypothetical protein